MIEKIIEISTRKKFLVFLGVFLLSAWGIWALSRTPLDAIPDISDMQVIIFTQWPGRSPDLIEDQITYPIVTSMVAAPKVNYVRGVTSFGVSYVNINFQDGTDMYWARSRVLEYLSKIGGTLPKGVNPILGPDATGLGWVFQYALVDETGKNNLAELRSFQDWHLKYWLESVPGVAEVATLGGFVKQYQVEVNPDALLAYRLPLQKVIHAIRRSNNDVGGRVLEFAGTEYMVRGRGYIKSVADIEGIPVAVDGGGTPVFVRDVAHVTIGPDIRRGLVDLDGKGEVVGGVVVMRYGESALGVINRVKRKLEELKSSFPEGVKLVITYDRSDLIHGAIGVLKETLVKESLVVSLIVILFLLHFRSALVVILILPIGILLSFIPMYYLGITSNIMSLGGIAIAIGVMVDAAIVMVENAHKRLEQAGEGADKFHVIVGAAKEVGKPLFFSLMIVTISFLPIFTLEAQEGRLFQPLAFTKTFAMFFASFLSITLAPVLMVLLLRGKIRSEARHPISRILIFLYRPLVKGVLRFRWTTLFLATGVMLATIPVFQKLGSEFMPPLNEGVILYMPGSIPGISITTAARTLQMQDKVLKSFPEVLRVFGKIGRGTTATDTAPLNMVETHITLKPKDQWRPGMTWDKLIQEMNRKLQMPGIPNIWWMPIQTRIEMLATGIRSVLGIKILGPDLKVIEKIGISMEPLLVRIPGTRSVFAERVLGGNFLDFEINRAAAARYGLTVGDVQDIIESAIGGKNISTTVEGRERYPINVRYPRELRDDVEKLKRILVATPSGAHVPIGQVADIKFTTGPSLIRDENGSLAGFVFVDVAGRDIGGYVDEAKRVIEQNIQLPPGYTLVWAGQYQYLLRAKKHLKLVVPLTLLIVFVLLYMNFESITKSIIVILSVPFSLVGSVWLLSFLEYNLSVAVWVGLIGLAGLAAETGVVMLVFLDEAHDRYKREGKLLTLSDLREAVTEGAVLRLRPKMMTVLTTMMGLLPIMWAETMGTGGDVMKRMAAPMIGGLVTSTVLTLLVIPAIYSLWREWGLPKGKITNDNI